MAIFATMVNANFGIKIFNNCNLLLTESCELVHYGNEIKGNYTLDSLTNIYFYIKDDKICQNNNDSNYVTNVVEFSNIPIYKGIRPNYCFDDDDYEIQKLIKESKLCLYYYYEECKLKFFLHFSYKRKKYDIEISQKVLSLLKQVWFTSQTLSFDEIEKIGEDTYNYISSINVDSIIKNFKIISGKKEFRGIRSDWECTEYAERYIIDTNDYYILNTLHIYLNELFPQQKCSHTKYMYGTHSAKEYSTFSQEHLLIEAKLNCLDKIIASKSKRFDLKDCIKYVLIRKELYRPGSKQSIEVCKLDKKRFEKRKTNLIISRFINDYNVGRHMARLLYIVTEAIKVPDEMLNETIATYNEWLLDEVENSGLNHLATYHSGKDICDEFNKHSKERFNFNIDFQIFNKESNDFDWSTYNPKKTHKSKSKENTKQEIELRTVIVNPTPLVDFSGDDLSLDPRFW